MKVQALGGLGMSFTLFVNTILLLTCSLIAAAKTPVTVPSEPKAWPLEHLERPPGTAKCPGGEVSKLLVLVPELKPVSRVEYENVTGISLEFLRAIEPDDRLYSFNFGTRLSTGRPFRMAGFYLVRSGCIVHVHRLEFVN